jgi:hypothetical protein
MRPRLRPLHDLRELVVRRAGASGAQDVIAWWEVRRLPYNLLVGACGAITCCIFASIGIVSESLGGDPVGLPDGLGFAAAFMAVLMVAFVANACYTLGWVAELAMRKAFPREAPGFGPLAFASGLVFSIVVTLAPGAALLVAALVHARFAPAPPG